MGITVWRIIAAIPAIGFSLWAWLATWALAPGHLSAAITVLWTAILAAAPTRTGQNALMWLIPAHPPSRAEQQTLAGPIARMRQTAPAATQLRVRVIGMPGIRAAGSGRHNIVVTHDTIRALQAGRITTDQMAALLVSAAGQVISGTTRLEWPLAVLTLPWLPFRILLQAFMILFGATLPVRFILKVRGLYAIGAFIQTTTEGHPLVGLGVLTAVAATYWQPHAARKVTRCQTRAGDRYAAEQGFGSGPAESPRRLRS